MYMSPRRIAFNMEYWAELCNPGRLKPGVTIVRITNTYEFTHTQFG